MRRSVIALGVCLLFATGSAVARDLELEAAVDEVETALEGDANLSPELKEALSNLVGVIGDRSAVDPGGYAPVSATAPGFWDRVTPFADIRLRHEHDGRRGRQNRDRERVRFRFGANVDLGENWSGGFRIRTGDPSDSQSPYHNFGSSNSNENFSSLEFNLDRVFLTYRPPSLEGSWITAGKFDHPFAKNPVYGELVWDDDANPEGVAAGIKLMPTADFDFDLTAGNYLLEGDDSTPATSAGAAKDADNEFWVFVAQAAARFQAAENTSVLAALGWYRFGDTEPGGSTAICGGHTNGNITTASACISDFHIWNPILAVSTDLAGLPFTVSGEYIINTGADNGTNEDSGYAVGASLGKAKAPGDWSAFYQWQRIQSDAVFTPVAGDDFITAQSNFRGHVFGVKYKLTKRIGLRAWGLMSQPEDTRATTSPNDDHDNSTRLRLDLDAKF